MLENYFKYLYNNVVSASREKFMELLDGPADSLLDLGCWDGANTVRYGKKPMQGTFSESKLKKIKLN